MEYRAKCPFYKGSRDLYDGGIDRVVATETWEVGVQPEHYGSDGASVQWWCNAEGEMVLTEISRHRPSPRYPERVFYTRQFIDPDGRTFGKSGLRITTAAAFKRRCAGYITPDGYGYEVRPPCPVGNG